MKKRLWMLLSISFLWYCAGFGRTAADSVYFNHLYYTCKVWGFLKYFGPFVARGDVDWDDTLINLISQVKRCETNEAFNQTMENLINLAVPACNVKASNIDRGKSKNPSQDWDWQSDAIFSKLVSYLLTDIRKSYVPVENRYYSIRLNQNPQFDRDNKYQEINGDPTEEIRLLALFRYWNIVQYFYPYRNLMDQDWEMTLKEFIPKMVSRKGAASYYYTLLELRTRLNDSHAALGNQYIVENILGTYCLPIFLKTIENQTVVFQVLQDDLYIKPGDVIKAIDGRPIQALRDSLHKIAYGSNQAAIDMNINQYLIRGSMNVVNLTIENKSGEKSLQMDRSVQRGLYYTLLEDHKNAHESVWRLISLGSRKFGYVDLGRLERNDIFQMVEDIWESDALVFDMRGYPKGTMGLLINYLLPGSCTNALFLLPVFYQPGQFYWSSSTVTANATKKYQNPICILVDENTISQAEYTVMTLQLYPNTTVIGSQTAGADGNVVDIYLPGGVTACMTGMGVAYPDTTQTQRVGIVPDIVATCAIQGVREGRDEVLEKAMEVMTDRLSGIEESPDSGPSDFQVSVHPNPFQTSTAITFRVQTLQSKIVTVYNILGRPIRTLQVASDRPHVIWDGRDEDNVEGASGIYFISARSGSAVHTMKVIRIH